MAEENKRCVILAAAPVTDDAALRAWIMPEDDIICADGGFLLAKRLGLTPFLILGDFDSTPSPANERAEIMRFPREKDDTDTFLAVREAIRRGYAHLTLLGGTGGRIDHTLANIAALQYAAKKGVTAVMADSINWMTVLCPGTHTLPRREGYKLSVFPLEGEADGITYEGLRYPLTNALLRFDHPIAVSNEWEEEEARITVKMGDILVIASKD